jgi:formylglycine-generating enzyme required for sulfatase activity
VWINTSTGAVTDIGRSVDGLEAIAFIPEPYTIALTVVGFALFGASAFRRSNVMLRKLASSRGAGATIVISISIVFAPHSARAVTIDWVTVGNPGNFGDTQYQGIFGAVGYTYRISKHEVTNSQYTEFLNAVDPTGENGLSLYNIFMSRSAMGGIYFNSVAADGSKYEIKPGHGNNPVGQVSFFDAMRFVNWLENGQGSGSTETGVYSISNGVSEVRNPSAKFFVPNENEWYKSAYHKNDGVTGNYWDFPTSTDAVPYSDQPPGSDAPNKANTANFSKDDYTANGFDDGFAVTGTLSDSGQNCLTDTGAYSQSLSPYGTFDQGGNVWEWTETVISTSSRVIRGGDWGSTSIGLNASFRLDYSPAVKGFGFRVASIPEPSTGLLVVIVCGLIPQWRW